MAFSQISRLGRGLILSNRSNEVIKDESDNLVERNEDVKHSNTQEDPFVTLGNTVNSNISYSQRETVYDIKSKLKESEEDKNEKWGTFIEDLYQKFSEYTIQNDRQRYNVANLDDWGKPGKPQDIFITPQNFEEFLNKIENFNVAEFETIKSLNATISQLQDLNQVLSLTLKHKPTIRCSDTHIIVKDILISLKETMQNLISNSDTDNSCKDFNSHLLAGKYDLLKVFALNKLFIDTDLSFTGKRIPVAIIAPNWEVEGSRSIELSQDDGTPPTERKAKTGAHPGNNGENGVPGNPGISGETFFGIGSTFVGGKKLKIISNGGKGGAGQAGGDGAPGMPGKDAIKPAGSDPSCTDGSFREFRCENKGTENFIGIGSSTVTTHFYIYGLPGGNGGNGGDGGKGGRGGDPGNIDIIELRQPSNITKLSTRGEEGDIGKGGVGGQGGKNGNDVKADFNTDTVSMSCFWNCITSNWGNIETSENNGTGSSGSNGVDGRNIKGIKDPTSAKGISRLSNIINEYKIYLRENINYGFQRRSLLQFLHLINSNNDLRKLYDIFALIDEFHGLEEQLPKLHEEDVFHFYSLLLERINAFAKGQADIPHPIEIKKVLTYLYTAALGRLNNFKENSEQHLIIDMRAYLKMVEDNIKTLENIQVINNKVDVVNKYKENYTKGIDQKINEANSLIDNQISPEIQNIDDKISGQVNSLIEETIDLEKEAETEWEKLSEKRKELQNAMELKGMFNCFKIIRGVVSFLGPYGQIAGAVIDGVSTVTEPFVLDDKEKILNLPENIASSLTTLNEKIQIMRDQKITFLNKILKNLSKDIDSNHEKLGDMKSKIEEIEEKLQKVSDKEIDFKHVSVLENELNEILKLKEMDLKTHTSDEKTIDALRVIDKFAQIAQFGTLFSQLYEDINDDKEKIDEVTTNMEEMKDKIVFLREYEKNIYETTAPMLQEMEDQMKEISAKLGTKSHVALDVTKWQVQSSLKSMKLQMQKLTEGRAVKDDLSRSIENMDEVMTTLINVYDRIQSYHDQQNLANYIADISSVAASNINIKNQQLVNAVNHLEFVIRANIVLEQYKSAMDALKQWVFPFAENYIDKSILPSQLQLDKNIANLVENAVRQVEAIKQKVDLYDASIRQGDQYLECEEFSSRYVSSQPFYVWKSKDFRRSISRLLSGKEVLLQADVRESAPHKDAIKFSEIEFDFQMENKTAQTLLSEILKGFDISATHLGNSYYRYANNITLITSDSVTISYSFEKDDDGIPIRSNKVYNRLQSGDLLLSPYTLWEVIIINETNKYSFQDFEKYKNDINIELSGLGSYVDTSKVIPSSYESFTTGNNDTLPLHEPKQDGLNDCRRFKQRSTRSVRGFAVDTDFMTNGAPKDLSSPFNFLCNSLKIFIVSNLPISFNKFFLGENPSVRSNGSELSDEGFKMRKDDRTETDATSAENESMKEKTALKSNIIVNVNVNDHNNCLKRLLLIDQKHQSNNNSPEVPDLNCSLLLADLVTRTVTGNKYKSPINECLLSPREMILGKINEGGVQDETDVKQILQRFLSVTENNRPNSWFSKVNGYVQSMLQNLGFVRNYGIEEYVQDVRHLFAQKKFIFN